MNIGEARNVNKLILWATEGHRAPGMGWQRKPARKAGERRG